MGTLILVRHGQASIHGEDYDVLSSLGEEQSRHLGDFWAARGVVFDRVLVGPRRRHLQTHRGVAEAYKLHGLPFPDAEPWTEFDEHSGPEVIEHHRQRFVTPPVEGEGESARLRRYLKGFQKGTLLWARGELETPPGFEPWGDFRGRVETAVKQVAAGSPGQTVVIFTSGGTMSLAVGCALGLVDTKIMELSWRVKNAAFSEILFSRDGRLTLTTFNTTPHLQEPRLVSLI